MKKDVMIVTGAGQISMAIARRTGFGKKIILGDKNMDNCESIAKIMNDAGYDVEPFEMDLSSRESIKAMIAKALAQQTPIIFLDEPTAFLDYPSKIAMMQLLRRLAHEQNKLILLSTHDLEIAFQTADNIWLLQRSGLQAGTLEQLAESGAISAFLDSDDLYFDIAARRIVLK
jgi:ABC-type cobalamin/Fe3+-siderophores transport system ATPase subunit